MNDLFSHALQPTEAEKSAQAAAAASSALYIRSEMPVDELWTAFTEYTHLWWPRELKRGEESYVEFAETHLLEEEEDAAGTGILAEIVHLVVEDVIAVRPLENQLAGAFRSGLSFVFDVDADAEADKEAEGSLLEISSGLVAPREVGDSELGLREEDRETARLLLGGFSRFIGARLYEE